MEEAKEHLLTLARYHQWATGHLFLHIQGIPEEDYKRDFGLFFKSVHGTLNHLLVAERLWYTRFADNFSPVVSLDTEVESDRLKLRELAIHESGKWESFIQSLSSIPKKLEYSTMRGFQANLPYILTLAHVFNHGTHHRGQIIAAITAMGYSSPEIDLVYMLQAEEKLQSASP
ncbi:damage-inducible protein DinB [Leptospira kobayashii]|uniref:Damage-inducible protein DinB n=1 Tax=Leptospira kobayashii TaxID=1917830 RepID=A0ABM7UTV2_9LEPT|nr:DinB family protein [Leptospira kobayashii]BDA80846.1 damage-inducible protein DinB [Leptospira kobayashii]